MLQRTLTEVILQNLARPCDAPTESMLQSVRDDAVQRGQCCRACGTAAEHGCHRIHKRHCYRAWLQSTATEHAIHVVSQIPCCLFCCGLPAKANTCVCLALDVLWRVLITQTMLALERVVLAAETCYFIAIQSRTHPMGRVVHANLSHIAGSKCFALALVLLWCSFGSKR